MSTQSSYSRSFDAAFAGQPGDSGYKRDSSSTNTTGSAIPAGIGVCQATAVGELKLPAAATDKLLGLVLNTFSRNPGDGNVSLSSTAAIVDTAQANIREQGAIYALVEEAVTVADPVYMRFTANGTGKLQLGAFRNDPDGVAQVTTVTPGASQNTTLFTLRVSFSSPSNDYEFTVVSDGSMTATEVCDAFRVTMAADAEFTARVVATGTATLILTGQVAGEVFLVRNDGTGTVTVTATTPAAPTCRLVKGARFLSASTGAGVAQMYIDVAVDRAFV